MTLHTELVFTDDADNTLPRIVLRRISNTSDCHEGTEAVRPIDHPPGHEIERLNREIEEQYGDVEWTPASVIAIVLIALPFVAYGIYVLVAGECRRAVGGRGYLGSRLRTSDSVSQGNCLGFRDGRIVSPPPALTPVIMGSAGGHGRSVRPAAGSLAQRND
jgi:hypothetical protein